MRFIGNKTKVLPSIEEALASRGLAGGTLLDIFTGTASVARRFREQGWRVVANDRMLQCWAQAVAALAPERDAALVSARLAALAAAPPRRGLVSRLYAPRGEADPAGRRFFTPENAGRIDGALETLSGWLRSGEVDDIEAARLLAPILGAADRVANISGTYGAYIKSWQPNALQPFEIRRPPPVAGPPGWACRGDALEVVARHPCDLLYVDPPYNEREYHANYHVLEAIAARPFLDDAALRALERSVYGKTGLLPYEKSDFCSPRRCAEAFRALIARSRARAVLVSYSEEGILSKEEITGALRDGLGTTLVEHIHVSHKRFRSDRDREGRAYRVIEGRERDEVHEWLFFAAREAPRTPSRARRARVVDKRGASV